MEWCIEYIHICHTLCTRFCCVFSYFIKAPHYCPFVSGIHRRLVDSPHKGPVRWKVYSPCHHWNNMPWYDKSATTNRSESAHEILGVAELPIARQVSILRRSIPGSRLVLHKGPGQHLSHTWNIGGNICRLITHWDQRLWQAERVITWLLLCVTS